MIIINQNINKKNYRGTFNNLSNISCDRFKVLTIVKKNIRFNSIKAVPVYTKQHNKSNIFKSNSNIHFNSHYYGSIFTRSFSSSCSINTQYKTRGVQKNKNLLSNYKRD